MLISIVLLWLRGTVSRCISIIVAVCALVESSLLCSFDTRRYDNNSVMV